MNNELATIDNNVSLVDLRMNPTRFPRLKNIPIELAYKQMFPIVAKAFLYKGQTLDNSNVQFIASSLVDELLQDDKYGAGYITIQEVARAVKNAVLHDEMFGVSVATLYKAIINYCKNEGHQIEVQAKLERERRNRLLLQESSANIAMSAYAGKLIKK